MAIAVDHATEIQRTVEELPLASITPAPDNPRKHLDGVDELAASMSELGLLNPLVVTPRQGKFMVVCGHRRHAAAKTAGLAVVPVIVRELDEPQRIKAMLIENCQRSDLSPLEEARGYKQLVDLGLTQRQIAGDVGKSQSHIAKRLALLDLTPKAQTALDSGGITLDDARALLELKDMPKRLDAALKEGQRYGYVGRAVRQELAEHELAEKTAAAVQKLTGAGVKIIKYRESEHSFYGPQLPSGIAELVGRNGYAYDRGRLAIDPKTHAKEPCHAAAVKPRHGEIVYLCTNPSAHKGATGARSASADEKAAAAKERAKERARALQARDHNIELGRRLTKKFATAKLDTRNLRLLADLLVGREAFGDRFGNQLALRGLRYTDEASQTVVTRKDGSVSRIVHADDPGQARKLLDDRLAAAKTPEEIMGVLLQALIAARYADMEAVPPSRRNGRLSFIDYSSYSQRDKSIKRTIEKIAGPIDKKAAA